MRKFLSGIGLIVCVAALSSCGYTTRSSSIGSIRTIAVESFKNNIAFTTESRRSVYLPLLEIKIKQAIIDRFLFDGNLKITSKDLADLVLKGELINYERSGLRFSDNDDVEEYRVVVTMSLELFNQDTNEVVWSEPGFSGEATYFISGAQASSEDDAVSRAITDLARRVVERTVEDW